MGHSLGGSAGWAFAEREADYPIAGYLETFTISPPARMTLYSPL
jgi:hypothetical protein